MAPFFNESLALGAFVTRNGTVTAIGNTLLSPSVDEVGGLVVLGSRLIPSAAYKSNPQAIGGLIV
jgi:hypothetical protein